VLLIGAETLTRIVDPADRASRCCSATAPARSCSFRTTDAALGPFDARGRRHRPDDAVDRGRRDPHPRPTPAVADGRHYLTMRGGDVYRHAVAAWPRVPDVLDRRPASTVDDVDLFVGHQANARILDAVAQRLGIDPTRSPRHRRPARQHLGGLDPARARPTPATRAGSSPATRAADRVRAGLTWGRAC
jgi:3-oxoacyl-[acyl-carrier-protein] synthase III